MARKREVEGALWYWLKQYRLGEPVPADKMLWCETFLEGAQVANLRRMEEGHERSLKLARRIVYKEVMEEKSDSKIAEELGVTIHTIKKFRRVRKYALKEAYAWCEQLLLSDGNRERVKARAKMLNRVDRANERYDEVLNNDNASDAMKFRVAKDVLDRVDPPTKKVEHTGKGKDVHNLNIGTLNLIEKSMERGQLVPNAPIDVEAEVVDLEDEDGEELDFETREELFGEEDTGDE